MAEIPHLVSQIQATAGDAALVEVLRGLLALARDEAVTMEVRRPRDTLDVSVTKQRRFRLPKAA